MGNLRERKADHVGEVAQGNQVLIAAHRGSAAGNIVQNTVGAFRTAQAQGADILELDVSMTTDGVLVVYHDGGERTSFGIEQNIQTLSYGAVQKLRYFNSIGARTRQGVQTLDYVLGELKGDVLINVDRGWEHWTAIVDTVERHDMADQIILKSPSDDRILRELQSLAPDYMYMPICRSIPDITRALQYDLNTVAIEVVFASRDEDIVLAENLKRVADMGLLLWVNAIQLNEVDILCDTFDDVTSILDDPNEGWGRLVDMGFQMIQTDFPRLLRDYLESRGLASTSPKLPQLGSD